MYDLVVEHDAVEGAVNTVIDVVCERDELTIKYERVNAHMTSAPSPSSCAPTCIDVPAVPADSARLLAMILVAKVNALDTINLPGSAMTLTPLLTGKYRSRLSLTICAISWKDSLSKPPPMSRNLKSYPTAWATSKTFFALHMASANRSGSLHPLPT